VNKALLIRIAWQLLRARMKQSLVAAAGVMFGIAMFITLVSFMTGLNKMLDGLILNRAPHVRIYNEIRPAEKQPLERAGDYLASGQFIHSVKPRESGRAIRNSDAIMTALRQDPRVLDVAPKVSAPVFYQSGVISIAGQLNGIDPLIEKSCLHSVITSSRATCANWRSRATESTSEKDWRIR
jgi:lipoprotein-releasing system permease protein